MHDQFCDLIDRIYETPPGPERWETISYGLMALTGSTSACISIVDQREERYCATALFGAEDSSYADGVADYGRGMAVEDPTFHYALANPQATLIDSEVVIGSAEYLDHPFVRWTQRYFRTTHWRIRASTPRDGLQFGISMHTPAEKGRMGKADAKLFDRIFPHVRRAVLFNLRPPQLVDPRTAYLSLDRAGRVMEANGPASTLLDAADGLQVRNGRLLASGILAQKALDEAVGSALAVSMTEACTGAVALPRPSGKTNLLLVVDPLPRQDFLTDWLEAAAIVRIVDPAEQLSVGEVHARLFELTAREREVACLLLRGHSPEIAAAHLGISYETARVHLRALFRKTGTSRQAQLIERLLRVA